MACVVQIWTGTTADEAPGERRVIIYMLWPRVTSGKRVDTTAACLHLDYLHFTALTSSKKPCFCSLLLCCPCGDSWFNLALEAGRNKFEDFWGCLSVGVVLSNAA